MTNIVGWECPKCGTVWAPYVQSCSKCRDANHPLNPLFPVRRSWDNFHPARCRACGGYHFDGMPCPALTPTCTSEGEP